MLFRSLGLGGLGKAEAIVREKVERYERQGIEGKLSGERLARFVAGMLNNEFWADLDIDDRATTATALHVPAAKLGARLGCRITLRTDGESVVAAHFYYQGNGVTHAVRQP